MAIVVPPVQRLLLILLKRKLVVRMVPGKTRMAIVFPQNILLLVRIPFLILLKRKLVVRMVPGKTRMAIVFPQNILSKIITEQLH
jgi:hypothetical protein